MKTACIALPFALFTFASAASAQLDDRWLKLERAPDAISGTGQVSDADNETDLAWGDLNGDGATDLIVVRKEPFITTGGRTNLLLLAEEGTLVNRTAALASRSDVEDDHGFLTPTNDRDVLLADLDGDGWLDVATAVDQSPGAPKHISHPRVYRNSGRKDDGPWLGIAHEDARFPALVHLDSGEPIVPHFTCVSAGDVDADGDVDLYFGDYDVSAPAEGQQKPSMETPEQDGDDRLMLNDGKGFFADGSKDAVSREILASNFCNVTHLVDLNMDDKVDLLKQSSYQRPSLVYVAFNDPDEPGSFQTRVTAYEGKPYFISTGDLNNDGRLDMVVSDNGLDRHIYNLPGEEGSMTWSEPQPFEFLHGQDDKFAGNSLIVDLDGDGWRDVIVTDVDPEIPTYDRRTHIYHNRGGTEGGTDIVLREEREKAADEGWIGAVGLSAADLQATHDAAVFDLNGDGKLDLILSRLAGLEVWLQVE
ncbi:MAG: VCBS repeat-containing protein [Planctomycetota bacterium]